MYNPPYFKEKDTAVIQQFIREHPFALLAGSDAQHRPVATQVPLLVEWRGTQLFLLGHMQRKTDHQLAFEQNPQVLAIFSGPHTYVSASWYSNPQTASTWNYMSVHAKGIIRFLDREALLNILSRTTEIFEGNDASPALVEKMPAAYLDKMMKAIVAFEIAVNELDNIFKLSQNRDEKSYATIISQLQELGGQAAEIAQEMQRRQSRLFGNE